MVPAFAKAAKQLSAEHPISPLVKTKFGFHVLQFVSSKPAKQRSFDDVKEQIIDDLRTHYVGEQKQIFLSNLASQKMTPYPKAIASLRDRYFTGTGVPINKPLEGPNLPADDASKPAPN
jgi:peptidyl-prolyl cis-trans isomerase C